MQPPGLPNRLNGSGLKISFFIESSGIDHPGKECKSDSIYTVTPDSKCDGWSGISYEECKKRCKQNELPSSCKNHPDVKVPLSGCGFASWTKQTSWCHLIGNDCEMLESSDHNVWEKLKTGNTVKHCNK